MSGFFIPAPTLRGLACAAVDATIVAGSLLVALFVRFGDQPRPVLGYEALVPRTAVLTGALLLCLYYNNLYDGRAPRNRLDLLLRVGQSFAAAAVLLALVYYAFPELTVGRGLFVLHLPLAFVGLLAWRATYYWTLRRDSLVENVVILGTGGAAKEIAVETLRHRDRGYRVLGFISHDPAEVGKSLVNPGVIGTFDDLPFLRDRLQVDVVVVALEDRRGRLPLDELLRCKLEGIRIEEAASFYEGMAGQLPVRSLRPSWLIFSQGFRKPRLLRNVRRVVELVVALVGIVISFPILALGALATWLDSGRPLLYRQERVGERGRVFTLYKLRTMRVDAENETGPVWASEGGDPRITRVGRFLRKTRIDELPQLFNVLKGEMSFVGPRPERPAFVEKLEKAIPYYGERHSVRPGITGWAQVCYRYGASLEDAEIKLRYDLYYIKHMSLWLDLTILVDTAKVILFGRGAR